MEQSPTPGPINIVLIGNTGSGKSTLINQFVNYYWRTSFIVEEDETLVGQFARYWFGCATKTNIKVVIPTLAYPDVEPGFSHSEGNLQSGMESRTQSCTTYTANRNINGIEYTFNLIDTPGINDTRGVWQDNDNLRMILEKLKTLEKLSAIVIVVNGRGARVTSEIRYGVVRIMNILPDAVHDKVYMFLTNCEDMAVVKFDPAMFKIKKENAYNVDNSAFGKKQNEVSLENQIAMKKCWDRSMAVTGTFMKRIIAEGDASADPFATIFSADPFATIFPVWSEITQLVKQLVDDITKIQQPVTGEMLVARLANDQSASKLVFQIKEMKKHCKHYDIVQEVELIAEAQVLKADTIKEVAARNEHDRQVAAIQSLAQFLKLKTTLN